MSACTQYSSNAICYPLMLTRLWPCRSMVCNETLNTQASQLSTTFYLYTLSLTSKQYALNIYIYKFSKWSTIRLEGVQLGELKIQQMFRLSCELHSSEGKGDRGKWTSDRAQTWDLCSIAEFQPHKLPVLVEILCPQSPLSTRHGSQIMTLRH